MGAKEDNGEEEEEEDDDDDDDDDEDEEAAGRLSANKAYSAVSYSSASTGNLNLPLLLLLLPSADSLAFSSSLLDISSLATENGPCHCPSSSSFLPSLLDDEDRKLPICVLSARAKWASVRARTVCVCVCVCVRARESEIRRKRV